MRIFCSILFSFLIFCSELFSQGKIFDRNIGYKFSSSDVQQAIGFPIDTILIFGNDKTKPFTIRQELPFTEGDSLNEKNLQVGEDLIYNLQLFNVAQVSAKQFFPNDLSISDSSFDENYRAAYRFGKKQSEKLNRPYTLVFINVNERWFIIPAPIFDLRGISISQWIKKPSLSNINIGLSLQHRNLFGYSDVLQTGFGLGFDPFVSISYITPYAFGTRTGFGISLVRRDINNLDLDPETNTKPKYIQKSFVGAFSLKRRLSIFQFLDATVSYTKISVVSATSSKYMSSTILPSGTDEYPTLSLTYLFSKLDFNQCATEGEFVLLALSKIGFPNSSDRIDILTGMFDFRFYRKIFGELSLGVRNLTFVSTNQPVPNYARLFFGYKTFVRGYTSKILAGDNLQLNSIELRYPLIPFQAMKMNFMPIDQFSFFQYGLYLTAFADAGNIWYNSHSKINGAVQTSYVSARNKYGYGVGVVFVGGYRSTMRLDYAFTPEGRSELIFSNEISF